MVNCLLDLGPLFFTVCKSEDLLFLCQPPLLMTCFITAVVNVLINNFSEHLRHPVLCVFAKSIGSCQDWRQLNCLIACLAQR